MRRPRPPRTEPLAIVLFLAAALLPALAGCGGDREPADAEEDAERTTRILEARTRGLVALEQDRLEEAGARFRQLAELAPEDPAGPALLARVALRRGEAGEAAELARDAREGAPGDPEIRLVLARALEMQGREEAAAEELRGVLKRHPDHLRALWALARAARGSGDHARRADLLERIVGRAPGSLAARLALIETRLRLGDAAEAAAGLEELRALVPEFPEGVEALFERALAGARAGDATGASDPARRLHERMRMVSRYRGDLERLRGPRGEATGLAHLVFSHEISRRVPDEEAVLEALRFRDATAFAGLAGPADPVRDGTAGASDGPGAGASTAGGTPAGAGRGAARVAAVGDFDGDGDADLYLWRPDGATGGTGRLLRNDLGTFEDVTPDRLRDVGSVRAAAFADVDGDGRADLYLARRGENRLFRNLGEGRFREVPPDAAGADPGDGLVATFADVDHDGDLDLLSGSASGLRLYRNDGTGSLREVPGAMGLAPGAAPVHDVAFADLDDDADLDLVLARGAAGVELFVNDRGDRFRETTAAAGLAEVADARALALGDHDNDGRPDLLVAGADGSTALHRNRGGGRFVRDRRSDGILPHGERGSDAAFLDFDNDGHLDLAVTGRPAAGASDPEHAPARSSPLRPFLLRNDGSGRFTDRSDRLADDPTPGAAVDVFDYNEDGDLDLLLTGPAGPRLLRNDGGNANHHLRLRLTARGPGSGKVNRLGVGSQVEVRAGDLYQVHTVRGPVTHFGLGHRLKADVVRIVWTNGVPQYLHFPGTDQDLLEEQELKGSCAFVYAWNGERHEFVTDAMWRSAIGMPLGIMGGPEAGAGPRSEAARVHAPPGASREYLRLPPGSLEPVEGRFRLQLTEELWEVAYVDEVALLAVDHPAGTEVFLDERFRPPAPPELRLYRVRERLLPASAVDGEGSDLLPELGAADARYVSDLRAGPYQGIVEPHSIVLEPPPAAVGAEGLHLFLRGWIYPTDASINVAVSQREDVEAFPPRLEVPDGRGGWRTVRPDAGFPSGKEKTVVVDLTGVLPPEDPRVRIRTNMQIYWDHAFFAVGDVAGPTSRGGAREVAARLGSRAGASGGASTRVSGADFRVRALRTAAAHLHRRGFSREYRKGGRHGPHWFDYEDVTVDSPWLPIPGRYTRYGEVTSLLGKPDDRYVVMAPGDETTVEFDATSLPSLPEGWTRTFVLYTDGWIKDADLNTAAGGSVGPLPFHGQSRYPYGPEESFPRDSLHRAYLERYQTREVSGSTLRLAPGAQLAPSSAPGSRKEGTGSASEASSPSRRR